MARKIVALEKLDKRQKEEPLFFSLVLAGMGVAGKNMAERLSDGFAATMFGALAGGLVGVFFLSLIPFGISFKTRIFVIFFILALIVSDAFGR